MSVYVVERVVPNDGVLGVHATLTMKELGLKYGKGSYKVSTSVPGGYCQQPRRLEFKATIGRTYGPARVPDHRRADR